MRRLLIFAGLLATAVPALGQEPERPLDRLAAAMVGVYSSAEQANDDADFFNIRLIMVRAWEDRDDGYWLYVEQSAATSIERPYRQRVYHLVEGADGRLESHVYLLPDPEAFAGAWRRGRPLAGLRPEELLPREGCTTFLTPAGNAFVGATDGRECPSDLHGADYATSESRVEAGRLTAWDRGWAADGSQVWGARKGAYVFLRNEERPLGRRPAGSGGTPSPGG